MSPRRRKRPPSQFKWRLYADHNVERATVEYLRRSKLDVLWVEEEPDLRRQQDDGFHYREARRRGRFLLTKDADFWDNRTYPLQESPGVLLLDTKDSELAPLLVLLVRKWVVELTPDDPVTLSGTKIRVNAMGTTMRYVDPKQGTTQQTASWGDLFYP